MARAHVVVPRYQAHGKKGLFADIHVGYALR